MSASELEILVSQQQKELMAAQAIESDLDLAFKLQLEEAMIASLTHTPSSSSSSTLLHRSLTPSSSSLTSHSALTEPSDDPSLLKLQSMELERFQQEKKDREQSQSEMRRVANELKRQIHDSRFARAIQEMPEEEWEEFGDDFEKPMEETGEEEPFRLYFKGLVSNEFVKGSWVSLSAIGVAVCDSNDSVVLEIQKPLGVGAGRGVAETKALIEGLQAALSLHITNVNVFSDYVPIYNHVIGKWNVKQRKIADLVNQVQLLKQKFESFRIHTVARSQIKFVFQLARDAIESQIIQNVEPSAKQSMKESCSICLEDTDDGQMFSIEDCLHRYCFSCMRQHVEAKLLHGLVPRCPHEGCDKKLGVDSCRKFLSPKLIDIMVLRIQEASIPESDKFYCPYPKCSVLMSKREMMNSQPESSSKHQADVRSGLRRCIKCRRCFCFNCKVPWHGNMSCSEYKMSHPYPRAEDAKLQSLASKNLWRQCVKCKHMIELAEGCFHMTCRCGYEFCYTCGAEWRNKKATCSCPLWDEDNILYSDSEEDDFDDDDDDDDDDDESEYDFEEIPRPNNRGGYHIFFR